MSSGQGSANSFQAFPLQNQSNHHPTNRFQSPILLSARGNDIVSPPSWNHLTFFDPIFFRSTLPNVAFRDEPRPGRWKLSRTISRTSPRPGRLGPFPGPVYRFYFRVFLRWSFAANGAEAGPAENFFLNSRSEGLAERTKGKEKRPPKMRY